MPLVQKYRRVSTDHKGVEKLSQHMVKAMEGGRLSVAVSGMVPMVGKMGVEFFPNC